MLLEQRKKPLVIGVTGGIGSGKSAATAMFSVAGVDVIDADTAARTVVLPGSNALEKIGAYFGKEVLLPDKTLDRKKLRNIIFTDPEKKQWLEKLLHPLIKLEIEKLLRLSQSPYVILSSPLLFEATQNTMTDRVLVIDAPEQQQISRSSRRDGTSEEAIQSIMASQLSRSDRLRQADDVILNDQDLSHLENEVMKLHAYYCELAKCNKDS